MSLPDHISVALLLPRPASVDVRKLRSHLNGIMSASGMRFDTFAARHGVTLAADGLSIELRERDLPLIPSRLEPALSSGLQDYLNEDWSELVALHRAAITLDLRRTPIRRTKASLGGGEAVAPAAPAPHSRETMDLMLMAGHVAAAYMTRTARPVAIYWGASQRIFPTPRFRAMEAMLFPLPLFLHPRPVRELADDRQTLPEFELLGAPSLIGCSLRVAPARMRFDWMMKRVLAFVAHVRANNGILSDGSSFGLEEGERFTVRRTSDGGVGLVLAERKGLPVNRHTVDYFEVVA
jgi:hypothetical protein